MADSEQHNSPLNSRVFETFLTFKVKKKNLSLEAIPRLMLQRNRLLKPDIFFNEIVSWNEPTSAYDI